MGTVLMIQFLKEMVSRRTVPMIHALFLFVIPDSDEVAG